MPCGQPPAPRSSFWAWPRRRFAREVRSASSVSGPAAAKILASSSRADRKSFWVSAVLGTHEKRLAFMTNRSQARPALVIEPFGLAALHLLTLERLLLA